MGKNSSLPVFEFETSQQAWEGLNEELFKKAGFKYKVSGGAAYAYDVMIRIKEPIVDPKFNFARMFNYHDAKWVMLQNNYLDFEELDKVKMDLEKRKVKESSHFTHTLRFHNKKETGKECLISLTISKRQGVKEPVLIMHTRAIEVTKRFLLDLLLVQRIAEYILPYNKCSLTIYCPVVYQDADTFTMYHTHVNLFCLVDQEMEIDERFPKAKGRIKYEPNKWQERVFKSLTTFIHTPIDKIKYKVNRRCAKQLQIDKNGLPLGSGSRKMLAKDLKLRKPNEGRKKRKTESNPAFTG